MSDTAKINSLIAKLRSLGQARHDKEHLCYADGGMESNQALSSYAEVEAAVVLQAIFDPENQPSQFGTQLLAE